MIHPRAVIPWNDHAYIVVEGGGKKVETRDIVAYTESMCVAHYVAYGSIEYYQIVDAEHGFVAHGPPLDMKVAVGWDGVR
jgi:hypothetical protein